MPCKGCHGKAKHGGECEGCGERWQVSSFIYSLFILIVYSPMCEPDDLSSQKYSTMSISRFKYDGFVSTCRCAACVKNRKAVAPYMGGTVLCDNCGSFFFGAQVREMRCIRAETQRDSELYIHDIYTHTLTCIVKNMQEDMDAQLLRECRLGAAKVGTIQVPHIAIYNAICVLILQCILYIIGSVECLLRARASANTRNVAGDQVSVR